MSIKCILASQNLKSSGTSSPGASIILKSIEITKYPTKTDYLSGESFDPTGIELTVSYGIEQSDQVLATSTVAAAACRISPQILADDDDYVVISYTEDGVTVTTRLAVTVIPALVSIAVTPPTKTSYVWEDSFNTAGIAVAATFTDGNSENVTDYTISLANGITLNAASGVAIGSNEVVVSYSKDGRSANDSFTIQVGKKQFAVPSQSGTLIYNGLVRNPVLSGYDSTKMEISGNAQTNAGNYTAIVSLVDTDHYEWDDGTTENKNVAWSIGKANGSLSLNKTSIELTDTTPQIITITRAGNGAISYTPTSVAGLTMNLNGNTLTITGDGSTDISSQTITVKVAEGSNYKAPSNKTFTVSASYWSFGVGNGEVADEKWFTGLKNYLKENTGSSLKTSSGGNILGTTKSVTLTSSILGTTTHLIRIIGVDQDADNTVTWQTANSLLEPIKYNNGNFSTDKNVAMWNNSTCEARKQCLNYYNAFPGKIAIKIINKGTCDSPTSGQRDGIPTYNNETVWLPSEREMGFNQHSPISVGNSTILKSECTLGKNFSYSYYIDNKTRKKTLGDGGENKQYWERSRYWDPNSPTIACPVDHTGGVYGSGTYTNPSGLAPAFVIGNNTRWDEDKIADAIWWTDLRSWILSASDAELQKCVGKIKLVTLTTPVLGTTTHFVRVIGANQDGDHTLTFQTMNCLAETTKWSTAAWDSSNTTAARWIDSDCKAKQECVNYYNAFPGKSVIKTISKGTCDSTNDDRNGTPTYRDETVFLPSEREMNINRLSPLSTSNSTTSKAECTQGKNFYYSYYKTADARIKNLGDSGTSTFYWERSRDYRSSSETAGGSALVCNVGSSGVGFSNFYNQSYGLAPAFVIG